MEQTITSKKLPQDFKQSRHSLHDLSSLAFGKVPPNAKELEEAVLGAIMIEQYAYAATIEIINADCFYSDAHKSIYKAMQRLANKSQAIDSFTVIEELKRLGELEIIGGAYNVVKLTNSVVSSAHIENHCRIILEKYIIRQSISICSKLLSEAYNDSVDAFNFLDKIDESFTALRQNSVKKSFVPLDSLMIKSFQRIEDLRNRENKLIGITSGFNDLDMITCGFQNSDLIIVAARPGVGKTAFALNIARNAAMANENSIPVGFFSIEMSASQLCERAMSAQSEIWLWKIRNASMDDENMKRLYADALQPLSKAEIFIDDSGGLSINDFKAKARQMVNKHKVGMIIVDYLQLMTVSEISNREQQISFITRQLKMTAKELNIPIIALSQMSREVERRSSKEPQLSDLRESGAIEQDADMVMFIWRPTDADIAEEAGLLNCCYAAIRKHRNGALAKFLGEFQGEIQKWKFLKVVDENFQPVGKVWQPVTKAGENVDGF